MVLAVCYIQIFRFFRHWQLWLSVIIFYVLLTLIRRNFQVGLIEPPELYSVQLWPQAEV